MTVSRKKMDEKFRKTLVIIPARGGSKRIPQKNIKEICGQPMIHWPLKIISNIFEPRNVLVSTDCYKIKDVVEARGLKVPFMRPKDLSDDLTGTTEVVMHALDWYEKNVETVDYVLIVYPTSILLKADDLKVAMRTLSESIECDSIMSASKFPVPPQWALFNNSKNYAEMLEPGNFHVRSQDLTECFYDAAQFYLSTANAIRKGALLINSKVKLHILHQSNVVDIDTIEDFQIAEEKLKNKL
jgi:N-acylneuraminate cytidylyltransferase